MPRKFTDYIDIQNTVTEKIRVMKNMDNNLISLSQSKD